MFAVRRRRQTLTVIATCGMALAVLVANAYGHTGRRSPPARVPTSVASICKAAHIVPCTGHWRMLDGRKVFELGTPLTLGSNGRIRARAAAGNESRLYNAGAGLCMTSLGTKSNGNPAEDWTCNGSLNQTWLLENTGFSGTLLYNYGDQWCLTNRGGGIYNNNIETMTPCNTGPSGWDQIYLILTDPNLAGYHFMQTVNSSDNHTNYCVSSLGYTTPGSDIYEYQCNASHNQAWQGATLG